jgi:hypothetical protein
MDFLLLLGAFANKKGLFGKTTYCDEQHVIYKKLRFDTTRDKPTYKTGNEE